jgi:hypothetical protein
VVVLEAGDYLDDADFDGRELDAYQRSYLGGGPFPSAEGQVSIVAGTGVGGGTVINWTNCLRTYDHVRAEWASAHGLTDLAESDFDRHLDAVFERLSVNDECSDLNGPHQRMREGCEHLGYDFRLITRNADRDLYSPESAAFGLRRRLARSARARRPTWSTPRRPAPRSSPRRGEPGAYRRCAGGVEALDRFAAAAANGAPESRSPCARPWSWSPERHCRAAAAPGIGRLAAGDYLRVHPTVA